MKSLRSILLLGALALAACVPAFGQVGVVPLNKPVILMNRDTGTAGAKTPVQLQQPANNIGVQVIVESGVVSGGTVNVEGSTNGTKWATLASLSGSSLGDGAMTFIVDKPVNYIRANVSVAITGTSPVVSLRAALSGDAAAR